MLQAALVTFREGLESFLIVAVIVTHLRRTGRTGLVRGVHAGIAVSLVTCTLGAYLWYRWMLSESGGPNQALYEGVAALTAAGLVGWMLWQTLRLGRRLKAEIEMQIERTAGTASMRAMVGVALVTALLVTREGMEAVLFLGVQIFAARALPTIVGAGLGLLAAAGIAGVWTRYSHRLHMGAVLRVTAIFLALFLVQLVVYGLHELAESGLIQGAEGFHNASERFGPEGDMGHYLAYSLAGAPLLYLIFSRRRRESRPTVTTATAASAASTEPAGI
jgi:high-affinity iron transporter